jgi:hypothetical protein
MLRTSHSGWWTATVVSMMLPAATFAATQPDVVGFTSDGTVWNANLTRRYSGAGTLMTSASLGSVSGLSSNSGGPLEMIDGSGWAYSWTTGSGASADATLHVRTTLDQSYWLRRFTTHFDVNHKPLNYEIWVSDTGFDSMTQVVGATGTGAPGIYTDTLGSAIQARFIEYRLSGTAGANMMVEELEIFADANLQPQPTSSDGFNLMTLPGVTITDLTPGRWLDPVDRLNNRDFGLGDPFRGANNGDAQILVDLGGVFLLSSITPGFQNSRQWDSGGLVEISEDGLSWITVKHVPAGNFGQAAINVGKQYARYIRLTNFTGDADNALTELEVFGTIPEPATAAGMAAMLGALVLRRRR